MRSGTARQRTGNAVSAGADTLASTAPATSSLDELQVAPRSGEHCHSTALSLCVCVSLWCGGGEGAGTGYRHVCKSKYICVCLYISCCGNRNRQ